MIKNNKVSIAIKGEFLVNYTYKIFFGDVDITDKWRKNIQLSVEYAGYFLKMVRMTTI